MQEGGALERFIRHIKVHRTLACINSHAIRLIVAYDASSDVNRPSIIPFTSSRVSASSRISKQTSRIRASPPTAAHQIGLKDVSGTRVVAQYLQS